MRGRALSVFFLWVTAKNITGITVFCFGLCWSVIDRHYHVHANMAYEISGKYEVIIQLFELGWGHVVPNVFWHVVPNVFWAILEQIYSKWYLIIINCFKLYWARSRQNEIYKHDKKKKRKKELRPKREGHERDTSTHAGCPPRGNKRIWTIYNKNKI